VSIHIPEHYPDDFSANDYFVQFFAKNGVGVEMDFSNSSDLNNTVRTIREIRTGSARPAVYLSFLSDRPVSIPAPSEFDGIRYQSMGAGDRLEWDIPTGVDSLDTLFITYLRHLASGSTVTIAREPAGGGGFSTVGTLDTGGGSTSAQTATVTLSTALNAGDKLRFTADGSSCRIGSVVAYDADGSATSDQPFYLTDTEIQKEASTSVEFAFRSRPVAEATSNWNGGTAHADGAGTNGYETLVTEAWTKDALSWTPIRGYTQGTFVVDRETQANYDGSNLDTYEILADYTFAPTKLTYQHTGTANEDLTVSTPYIALFASSYAGEQGQTPQDGVFDTSGVTDGDFVDLNNAATSVVALGSADSITPQFTLDSNSPGIEAVQVQARATDWYKVYFTSTLPSSVLSSETWSASWSIDFAYVGGNPLQRLNGVKTLREHRDPRQVYA